MISRFKHLLHAIALASCLLVTMQIDSETMDGMRRAIETVAQTKKTATLSEPAVMRGA